MRLLCSQADLADGKLRRVSFHDRPAIVVARIMGEYFAVADRCSHGKVFLSRGQLDGYQLICPAHFGSFDMRTGQPIAAPCTDAIESFKLIAHEGNLYLAESAEG